jgi:hypothetical protein
MIYSAHYRIDTAVDRFRLDNANRMIPSSNVNPILEQFAQKIKQARFIAIGYTTIFFLLAGITVPIVHVIYDSEIPYVFVIFALLVMMWLYWLIIVLRSNIGKQMDKHQSQQTVLIGDLTSGRSNRQIIVAAEPRLDLKQ